MKQGVIQVAVPLAIDHELSYSVPEIFIDKVKPGIRVLVPVRNKKLTGYVLGWQENVKHLELKPIISVLDTGPILSPDLFELAKWISSYYMAPIGLVIQSMLPPGMVQESAEYLIPGPAWEGHAPKELESRSPLQALILKELVEKDRISLPALARKLGRTSLKQSVQSLVDKGLVRIDTCIDKEKVSPRQVLWAKLMGKREEWETRYKELLKQVSARSEVYRDLLIAGEAIPVLELDRKFRNARYHLKKLAHDGFVKLFKQELPRIPVFKQEEELPPELMPQQEKAMEMVIEELEKDRPQPILLHGITGSGKTELYLRAAETVTRAGYSLVVLVPEIGLTPLLMKRFVNRFGTRVALLHSGLSPGERFDEWRRIKNDMVQIAIGPRSAIFAPFSNLKLIIVDEEHDSSYKQNEVPYYNARDVAIVRGKLVGGLVILGSATPSLESYHNTKIGKYKYFHFSHRPGGSILPQVEVLNMRETELATPGDEPDLSKPLAQEIEACLKTGEQCLLFINRKGFSSFLYCKDCKHVVKCNHCDVTLTYHLQLRRLKCHACQTAYPPIMQCPECNSKNILFYGVGTQKVEEIITEIFPHANVARMDSDTMVRKDSYNKIFSLLEQKKINVLVGTQMITKGHDFPDITFVGVINADTLLSLPDFRAAENTFQLLTQVAGRAGRSRKQGKVLIQTLIPQHYAIQCAKNQDFFKFFEKEIKFRQSLSLPPFTWLANVIIRGPDLKTLQTICNKLDTWIKKNMQNNVEISGPAPAAISKLRNFFRYQVICKSVSSKNLHLFLEKMMNFLHPMLKNKCRVSVDIDPRDMM